MKLLVGIITMSFICACADEVPKTTNTYDTGIAIVDAEPDIFIPIIDSSPPRPDAHPDAAFQSFCSNSL